MEIEEAKKILRKNGYKQLSCSRYVITYILKLEKRYNELPEQIIIDKFHKTLQIQSDFIEKHTWLGTANFEFDKDLLQAAIEIMEDL